MALQSATKRKIRLEPASDIASSGVGTIRRLKPAKTGTAADLVLQEVLNRLPHEKTRCLDVETTGLDWRRNAIVGYVVTFGPKPQDSYYVPFRHAGAANVGGRKGLTAPHGWDGKLAPGEKELIGLLDRPGTLMFGHNLAFDLRFMSRVGFTLQPRFEDTIINEPLLDEYTKYSLEACAVRHKVQAKKGAELYAYMAAKLGVPNDKSVMGHYWRLSGDDRMAVDYATGDGTSTWQLRDAQMLQICKVEYDQDDEPIPNLELVHSVESRLIPVLARMMVRGVKVNEERLGWLINKISSDVTNLKNEFPSDFNSRSPGDVQKWMEKHGVTNWPRTQPTKNRPNGSPSFTEAWLETTEPGKKIVSVRKWENLNNSFCLPMRDRHLFNGRVHCTFNQLRNDEYGTVTGRLSSSDPNMQQVPKHDEETGRLYRSIFVPDLDVWGERDYSQIEPRLMAYYTRAKVFLEDYRNNPDADSHTAVAKGSRADWDQMSKAEQKHYRNTWAKRVNQTVITGGGARALTTKYKMSQIDAETALTKYHKTVPELKPFQKKASRVFRERGWVMDVLGRRAHLQDPDKDYTAMNRLLQMSNASILKIKMVEVSDFLDGERKGGKGPGVEMLLNCHDALSFQRGQDEKSIKQYAEIKRIMEDFSSESAVIKIDLPILVDEGEGKNWAEASYDD